MEDRNHWDDILKVLKEKDYQPKILCPEKKKNPVKIKKILRHFQINKNWENLSLPNLPYKKTLKGVLQADMRGHKSVTLVYVKK